MLAVRQSAARALASVLAFVLAAAGVVLVAAPPAVAGPGTCSIYWTGATNATWTTVSNWSLTDGGGSAGRIPVATDFVCMSTAPIRPAVTYPSGNRTIAGISFGSPSTVTLAVASGGILTIGSTANGAFDSTIRRLVLTGTIAGSSPLNLSGDSGTSRSRGAFTGTGVTTIEAGATFATVGLSLSGRRLVNNGTLVHDGCSSDIYLAGGSTIENSGLLQVSASCGTQISGDGNASNRVQNNSSGVISVNLANAGNSYAIGIRLQNDGTVRVVAGAAGINPLSIGSGIYDIASGAALRLNDGTLTINPGTITGTGSLQLNGGTLAAPAAAPGVTLSNLSASSGTVTGHLTVNSYYGAGTTFSGAGQLTLPAGTTPIIDSNRLTGGYTVLNKGDAQVDYLYLYDDGSGASGSYINEGATHSRTGRNATGFDRGATSATVINRAGAVLTVDQANANAAFRMEPTFTNLGQVNLTRGTLALGDVTDPPAGQTPGTYDVSSGATLRVNGGNLSVNPGTITGTGALVLDGGTLAAPAAAPGVTLSNPQRQ